MVTIGSLSTSEIESAFGLIPGDLKILSDPSVSLPFIINNYWTSLEGDLLRVIRSEMISSTCRSNLSFLLARFIGGVLELAPGGKSYDVYMIHNISRLYNSKIHFNVVGYINEGCRLVTTGLKVEKMTDLVLCTFSKDKCQESEICTFSYEGPSHNEFENFKGDGNWGKFVEGISRVDLQATTWYSPKWIRERKGRIKE